MDRKVKLRDNIEFDGRSLKVILTPDELHKQFEELRLLIHKDFDKNNEEKLKEEC